MICRRKRTIALVLLVIFTFSSCLLGLLLNIQLLTHRVAMLDPDRHGDDLVLVISASASTAEFHWVSESEFYHKGKIYDVIQTSQVDDNLIIVCENDAMEECLLDLMRGTTNSSDKNDVLFKKNIKYCDQSIDHITQIKSINFTRVIHSDFNSLDPSDPLISINGPPPRSV